MTSMPMIQASASVATESGRYDGREYKVADGGQRIKLANNREPKMDMAFESRKRMEL